MSEDFYILESIQYHLSSSRGAYPVPQAHSSAATPDRFVDGKFTKMAGEDVLKVLENRVSQRQPNRSGPRFREVLSAMAAQHRETGRRLYPSAGGLYAVDIVWLSASGGMLDGCYRVDPEGSLVVTRLSERPVSDIVLTQSLVPSRLRGVFVMSADLQLIGARYGDRAYRYALIEAGHIGHCLQLLLGADGTGCCPIGLFDDLGLQDLVNSTREPGPELYPVYAIGVP